MSPKVTHSFGGLRTDRAPSVFGLVALPVLVLSGCAKISGGIKNSSRIVQDFTKTEIIDNGSAPADGTSNLIVVIQLKNSDNTPVVEYQATYEIVSGSGVKSNRCTKSGSHGIAVCIPNATQPGSKKYASPTQKPASLMRCDSTNSISKARPSSSFSEAT